MMYVNRKGDIFSGGPVGNKSFDEDTFQVDTLMTPIIAELIKKGYMTNTCCHGHVYFADCSNYFKCEDCKDEQYEINKEMGIDLPYIMFADDVRVPLDDLPASWYCEFIAPRSSTIVGPEDLYKHIDFIIKPGYIEPMFDNVEGGFNLHIGIDKTFINLLRDDWVEHFSEDPYRFYERVVEAHRHLYEWAKNLPEAEQ